MREPNWDASAVFAGPFSPGLGADEFAGYARPFELPPGAGNDVMRGSSKEILAWILSKLTDGSKSKVADG